MSERDAALVHLLGLYQVKMLEISAIKNQIAVSTENLSKIVMAGSLVAVEREAEILQRRIAAFCTKYDRNN